jgi:hypothetical protein
MKIARSDARILAYGLLADGLDVDHLTLTGRQELLRALDLVLDLCGVRGAEIVPDEKAGLHAA